MDKTIKVASVLRVTDSMVRVRDTAGNVRDVHAPHDKTLLLREPFCGEGIITVPR